MSYNPFIFKSNTNSENGNFYDAALKVVSNKEIYETFHYFMDIPLDEDFGIKDVEIFLDDLYSIRKKDDKDDNIDVLSFDETNNSFKLRRLYFEDVFDRFFANMSNYNVDIVTTQNGRYLKFTSNDTSIRKTVKLIEGNGTGKTGNAGIELENKFLKQVNKYLDNESDNSNIANVVNTIAKKYTKENISIEDFYQSSTEDTHRFKSFVNTEINDEMEPEDCGKEIADFTFEFSNGEKEYVSLKNFKGSRIASIGTSKVAKFNENKLSKQTIDFFDQFNISADKIKYNLDNVYQNKKEKSTIDIKEIDKSDFSKFESLIIYSIGYGYWLVKETRDENFETPIYISRDILTDLKDKLKKDIQSIIVEYPKESSKTTQIRLKFKDTNSVDDILIQFKNTRGGIYPNKMMIIYPTLYSDLQAITPVTEDEEFDYTFDDDDLFQ